ncbi:TPA: phage tail protein [Aeromonas veronii]
MSNFGAILTNAGAAKLANAIALGVPLKLTQMAVGDGNGQPVAPDPAMTAIPGEKRRAAINTLFADPLAASQLVAEQIIPEDVGGWWIRCVGLFDDSNTLIAVANVPDTYKPLLTSGAGRTQIIRMVLIVSDTSAVELKIDPAVVLASRKYVDEVMKAHKESRDHPAGTKTEKGMLRLATEQEAIEGLMSDIAVAPKEMKAAMEALLDIVCPIGYPIPWVGSAPPNERFLMAQAQPFDKVKYPKLAKLWPSGVVPYDPRGKFFRGWDNGRGVDPGRAMLSNQGDAIRNITAKLYSRPLTSNQSAGAVIDGTGAFGLVSIGAGTPGVSTVTTGQSATSDTITFDASRVVPTAGENRPDNIAVNYVFRAS